MSKRTANIVSKWGRSLILWIMFCTSVRNTILAIGTAENGWGWNWDSYGDSCWVVLNAFIAIVFALDLFVSVMERIG